MRPMGIGAKRSFYFCGSRSSKQEQAVRANAISKTAWMDLYYDLYQQVNGEVSDEQVIADAERRLKILKANGMR